jgi:ribosomal subunit interface protein
MVLDVACRDSQLTVAGRKWVEEFSLRLERYFPDILTVHWDLTMEGNHHVATCRLHSRQGFYRASARDMDARLAMHTALDKLTRQRHREKRALGQRRREESTHETPELFMPPPATRAVHRGR